MSTACGHLPDASFRVLTGVDRCTGHDPGLCVGDFWRHRTRAGLGDMGPQRRPDPPDDLNRGGRAEVSCRWDPRAVGTPSLPVMDRSSLTAVPDKRARSRPCLGRQCLADSIRESEQGALRFRPILCTSRAGVDSAYTNAVGVPSVLHFAAQPTTARATPTKKLYTHEPVRGLSLSRPSHIRVQSRRQSDSTCQTCVVASVDARHAANCHCCSELPLLQRTTLLRKGVEGRDGSSLASCIAHDRRNQQRNPPGHGKDGGMASSTCNESHGAGRKQKCAIFETRCVSTRRPEDSGTL